MCLHIAVSWLWCSSEFYPNRVPTIDSLVVTFCSKQPSKKLHLSPFDLSLSGCLSYNPFLPKCPVARCPLWTGSQSTHKFSKLISIHVLLLLIIIPNCSPISLPDPGGLKDAGRSLEDAQCLLGYPLPYPPKFGPCYLSPFSFCFLHSFSLVDAKV